MLTWSKVAITDAKLYAATVTLSAQDNAKLTAWTVEIWF